MSRVEMTDDERIEIIKSATYKGLLKLWRFEPSGSPWATGRVGDELVKAFSEKKAALSQGEQMAISKIVGWDKP